MPSSILSLFQSLRTRGKNVRFNDFQTVAWRYNDEFGNGYTFTSRPVAPGESVVVRVCNTESMFIGGMGFGLTSCDPAGLRVCDFTEDSDALLDRPEYWVVMKDVAGMPETGDLLCFTLTATG
jgi:protein neuralized